jgi:hypothetical protein
LILGVGLTKHGLCFELKQIAINHCISNCGFMLRALLYIFGGLFTAYGLWGILYMIYWGFLNGSVEPEMQEINEFVTENVSREIGEASVSLFMGLVLLSLERIIRPRSE